MRGLKSGLALVALWLVAVVSAPSAADPLLWKAVAASGTVQSAAPTQVEGTIWTAVRRGDRLESLSRLRTGQRSRTTLVHGASVLLVDPESRIILPATADAGGTTTVVQESGSVIYEIDGRVQPDFRVETPYLVAGVKGTVFMVGIEGDAAIVTVRYGEVEVTSRQTGDQERIRAGESIRVAVGETDRMEQVRRPGSSPAPHSVSDITRRAARRQLHRLDAADSELRFAFRQMNRSRPHRGEGADAAVAAVLADTDAATADDRILKMDRSTVATDQQEGSLEPREELIEEQMDEDTRSSAGTGSQSTGNPPSTGA